MKYILVPTDFSDISKNAGKFAIKFAASAGANLLFFHSQPAPSDHLDEGHPFEERDLPAIGIYRQVYRDMERKLKQKFLPKRIA